MPTVALSSTMGALNAGRSSRAVSRTPAVLIFVSTPATAGRSTRFRGRQRLGAAAQPPLQDRRADESADSQEDQQLADGLPDPGRDPDRTACCSVVAMSPTMYGSTGIAGMNADAKPVTTVARKAAIIGGGGGERRGG